MEGKTIFYCDCQAEDGSWQNGAPNGGENEPFDLGECPPPECSLARAQARSGRWMLSAFTAEYIVYKDGQLWCDLSPIYMAIAEGDEPK